MTIDLSEDLAEVERIQLDDYPDQKREHLVQKATELALAAVRIIALRMTELTEEEDLVEANVAESILSRFKGKISAKVLSARLGSR